MRSLIINLFLCLFFLSSINAIVQDNSEDYELKQVLILGRHHVRAPLSTNGSILEEITDKEWPKFDVNGGWLTTRGGILAAYMGNYTRTWLKANGLLIDEICPSPDMFFAYSNSMQRTVATAQFFIAGAFPACNIPVHHTLNLGNMDKVFNPSLNRNSDSFKKESEENMSQVAKSLDLYDAYKILDRILYDSISNKSKNVKRYSLSKSIEENSFSLQEGEEPSMKGPLRIANSLVDAFNMQYYEGLPFSEVAWGGITDEESREKLSNVINGYEKALFASGDISKDLASPLIRYIDNNFNDVSISEENPQVTLMIGHDSNIASLLDALEVSDYKLPGQFEKTPIGGQLVFQRWLNNITNESYVKVEYVYQTLAQVRNIEPLTNSNPPKRVTLYFTGLSDINNGYYRWDDFKDRLKITLL